MNYSVTLQTLRKAGACYSGYNKVVRALQGKEFTGEDKCRESYIRFNHKGEIPLTFILKSNGFNDTLWALRCFEGVKEAERDIRLFTVWCAHQVQHLMKDKRSFKALEVAERFANGEASMEELEVARAAAYDAYDDAYDDAYAATHAVYAAYAASRAASRAATRAARAAAHASAYTAASHKAQEEMLLLVLENKAHWQV